MTISLWLHYWLLMPWTWVILGLVLIFLEFLDGSLVFFLPFGAAGIINAGVIFGQARGLFGEEPLMSAWGHSLLAFALMGLVFSVVLRRVMSKRRRKISPDVNQY